MHYIPMVQVTPPKKPQTLINTPFLGVFLCLITTAKLPQKGVENTPKRYPTTSTLKKSLLGLGVQLGVQLGVHLAPFLVVLRRGYNTYINPLLALLGILCGGYYYNNKGIFRITY